MDNIVVPCFLTHSVYQNLPWVLTKELLCTVGNPVTTLCLKKG